MAGTRAAIRYAKAVLDLAVDQKSADSVNDDMKLIADTISANKDLDNMLQSPVVRSAVKKSALTEIFKSSDSITIGLIDALIANKRLNLLGLVASEFTVLYDRLKETQVAKVTTAVPLTDELRTKVLNKVKELTGSKDVTLENIIDEDILGGFILRVGDIQYNASVADKLDKLKREFTLN
ncbi:MAG: ATP synthase F1 subunit delta [Flavobacteriaceae bacterium]|nr:ATP synthase F1 subunit delta [Bacteroidia bacterium]NND10454.1 ATP synthase F1 subunit delta [Flavobacteriaceae bacterium]NNL60011.1 ATP synthase F1 subunit delta [Flavobacteriaceae bacterium]